MCPECDEPLIAFELEGIEVDHCLGCGGTWLDAGELETIAEMAGAESGGFSRALHEASVTRPRGQRRCPRCSRRLEVIRVGEEASLELDRCRAGHGLWLDRGELKDAIRSLHDDAEEEAVTRFFSELYRSELQAETNGG